MATIAGRRTALDNERRFFLAMALAIAVTVVAGFSLDLGLGRASFGMFPWQVHAHAIVFGSWIALYVVQTWLVVAGNTTLHRRLGVLGAIHAGIMVPLGIGATMMTVVQGRVPPFFPPPASSSSSTSWASSYSVRWSPRRWCCANGSTGTSG